MNTFTYSDIRLKIVKRIVPNHVAVTKADIVKTIKEGLSDNSITEVIETTYQVVIGTLNEISETIAKALIFDTYKGKAKLKFNDDIVIELECKRTNRAYCFIYFKDKAHIADMTYTLFPTLFITYVKDLLKDTNVNIDANDIQLKYIVSSEEVTI